MVEDIDYNNEPVHYCIGCLSLISKEMDDIEYCPYCGGTDFNDIHITEWEKKFEEKYQQGRFLNLNKTWKKIMEENNRGLVL